jgi:hypothetical protein
MESMESSSFNYQKNNGRKMIIDDHHHLQRKQL